ncbi:MAG: hypothetical protein LQ346_005622 [Caloplaca aetnensis]|nr:MAG: hypothetical protein LQ346_005622 [Caloplaca aetnensis]
MPRNQAAGRRAGEDLASQGPTTRKRTREADDQRSKGKEEKDIKPTPSKKQKSKTATGGADEQGNEVKEEKETQSAPSKKQKSKPATSEEDLIKRKIDTLLSKYGTLPLADLGLPDPSSPSSENVLALVYNAMLTSTRISHELAHKSVKCLIEAGYHDIETLRKSTWEERTEVLTKGGYTRYREKTATGLGELAEFVTEKYDNDLNNLVKAADSSPPKIRALLKEIKGIGNVGLDIFCDTAQHIWPCLAPFIDPRSMKTAQQCGFGDDVETLWAAVGKDLERMCRLAAALTTVRLEKKEKEFA